MYFRDRMKNETENSVESNINWEPLNKGGNSFKTHKLVSFSNARIEYRAILGYKLLGYFFLIAAVSIPILMYITQTIPILMILLALVSLSVGTTLYKRADLPIVFDKGLGYFWKGKIEPSMVSEISGIKVATKLEDIYGLQVIKELVRGKENRYYSYEINLILNSGERLNVVDYGNANSILQDASTLSKFLDRPVLVEPE